MKKFAPLIITAATMASLVGCSAQTQSANEMTAEDQAATCTNPEGTNAAIAALATAVAQEMHRWTVTTDFYAYNIPAPYGQTQTVLGITSAGYAACGGTGCPMTSNILGLQNYQMDGKAVFDGTKLSSWSFASRLASGFQKQQTCAAGGWCPFVSHELGYKSDGTYNGFSTSPGPCETLFTFNVTKPGTHGTLSSSEMSGLNNALVWTAANGANPYIAFQNTASTVSIDPTGGLNPPGQTTGSDICQKFSLTDINGTPCTCAANNIYSNGQLHNNQPLTPKTYYCTQM